MYGALARPSVGLGRQALSRAVVSATGAQLPMEPYVLLHAVANIGLGNNPIAGHRRVELHDIYVEYKPSRIATDAPLPRMAMPRHIPKLLYLAV